MPSQGGGSSQRHIQSGAPTDDALQVMVDGLWKYHRLLPPSSISRRKFWWDMFVIVLVLLNCFMIPMELAFRSYQDWQETLAGQHFKVFDFSVDFLFAVDIVLNFRTT